MPLGWGTDLSIAWESLLAALPWVAVSALVTFGSGDSPRSGHRSTLAKDLPIHAALDTLTSIRARSPAAVVRRRGRLRCGGALECIAAATFSLRAQRRAQAEPGGGAWLPSGSVREISAREMSFRAIFLALARLRRAQCA
jgi:hypothetical protein